MQIDIKIVTTDIEFGFHLLETKRFPERRPVIVPGEAVIAKQVLMAGEVDVDWADIVDLGVEINEDTSVDEFAAWLYEKLKAREDQIKSLEIAGAETAINKDDILRALEEGLREKK